MPARLRLKDCRLSRLPALVGLCQENTPGVAGFVNGAQRRLLYAREAGSEGWWGTFAELVFNVNPANPYITLSREMARIVALNVCKKPVTVQNQFFEYLQFGNGRLPTTCGCTDTGLMGAYTRNNVVTFADFTAGRLIRVRATDPSDVGKRVLVQGTDTSNSIVYSSDGLDRITGQYLDIEALFATTPIAWNAINGIQKDVTQGQVEIWDVDVSTSDETLLLTMEPGETVAGYRRYYLDNLPSGCCETPAVPDTVQVLAIVKLELVPVTYDPDYCLIQNLEAIIEECQSIRHSQIDSLKSRQLSAYSHTQAIRLLNGELNHYIGQDGAAVSFKPFGSASLRNVKVGTLY